MCRIYSRAYSRHYGHGCVFLDIFSEKKGTFRLLVGVQTDVISFLTISNENIFLKIQVTRLGAVNKGPE